MDTEFRTSEYAGNEVVLRADHDRNRGIRRVVLLEVIEIANRAGRNELVHHRVVHDDFRAKAEAGYIAEITNGNTEQRRYVNGKLLLLLLLRERNRCGQTRDHHCSKNTFHGSPPENGDFP